MDKVTNLLLTEVGKKVGKKTFIITLVVVGVFWFDVSNGLIVPILKSAWLGILLFAALWLAGSLAAKHSGKRGRQEYREGIKDFLYTLEGSEGLEFSVNTYKEIYYSQYQEILFANKTGRDIRSIAGHVDFYEGDTRYESIPFEIADVLKDKKHLIRKLEADEMLQFWNYVVVHVESCDFEDSRLERHIIQGASIHHVYDLRYLRHPRRDLKWLQDRLRKLWAIVRFLWEQNFLFKILLNLAGLSLAFGVGMVLWLIIKAAFEVVMIHYNFIAPLFAP